jgi:hypothetical protein
LSLPLDSFFESKEKETTFPHDGHWNESGHENAAAAIDEFLKELKVF